MTNLETTAAYGGGGMIIGFLAGFALKKIIKIIAIVIAVGLGLYFASLLYLRQIGIVQIDMERLENMTDAASSDILAMTTEVPGMEANGTRAIENIGSILIDALGLAGAGGLFVGFTVGFGVG